MNHSVKMLYRISLVLDEHEQLKISLLSYKARMNYCIAYMIIQSLSKVGILVYDKKGYDSMIRRGENYDIFSKFMKLWHLSDFNDRKR